MSDPSDTTTQERIDALLDERAALNELMATFPDERRESNYNRRNYIDDRLDVLRDRLRDES